MASGKLSPRQKMINMMYLVLTALLALNVSAEILEAFNQLRQALKESADNYQIKNTDTEKAIKGKVDEEIGQGNKKNEWIKDATDKVSKTTMDLVGWINKDIVATLEGIAAKDPETGQYTNIKELEANYHFWMIGEKGSESDNGGRGGAKAFELKTKLNAYVDWANKFIKDNDTSGKATISFHKIAMDPKEDPKFAKNSEFIEETWEYYTFHSKPVIADMAMVEKFKTDVFGIQYELLGFLKAKLGQVTFKIDSLIAVSAPESKVVAAGMKFVTKLFVAMSSKDIVPEFSGAGVVTDPGGSSATMTLQATGGFPQGKNEKEQSYAAIIQVPKADGSMAQLKVDGKFTVRKPEVVITSASVQNLYRECGNVINVDVPALGDFYDPKISGSDAEVLTGGGDKRRVTVVPHGAKCVLNVKSQTNGQLIEIDNITYKVIKPPRPSIEMLVDGKEYNGTTPINKKSSVTIRLKADSDFLAALPKDARYVINSIELLAQKSLGAPTKVGNASGSGKDALKGIPVETGGPLKSEVPGTKIYFKIDKIARINFQNKSVEEKFVDRELYIGAVIK